MNADNEFDDDQLERDFFKALAELKHTGDTISFSSVAAKAGHSRTNISKKSSRLPRVRELVLAEKKTQREKREGSDGADRSSAEQHIFEEVYTSAQDVTNDLRVRLAKSQLNLRKLGTRLVEAENIARHFQNKANQMSAAKARAKPAS